MSGSAAPGIRTRSPLMGRTSRTPAAYVAGIRRAPARIWTQEEITYDRRVLPDPAREVLPKPVQRPHPPLWSACGSDETARLTGSLGMGGLFGSEGGAQPRRPADSALSGRAAECGRSAQARRIDDAGYCMRIRKPSPGAAPSSSAGTSNSSARRARLVWRDYDRRPCPGLPELLRARPAPRQRAASR